MSLGTFRHDLENAKSIFDKNNFLLNFLSNLICKRALREKSPINNLREEFMFLGSVGSVTTLLLAKTKESEIMDTSSKQQRPYEESERELEEKWKEQRGGTWKLKSLKKGEEEP